MSVGSTPFDRSVPLAPPLQEEGAESARQRRHDDEPEAEPDEHHDARSGGLGNRVGLQGNGSAPGTAEFELFTLRIVGREGAIRRDWTRIEDPTSMREVLAMRQRTLAFLNREAVYPIPEGLRAVALGGCCARPTVAAIRAGRYPLSRQLYLYVRRGPLDALRVRSLARFMVENYKQLVAIAPTIVPAKQSTVERSAGGLPPAPTPGG